MQKLKHVFALGHEFQESPYATPPCNTNSIMCPKLMEDVAVLGGRRQADSIWLSRGSRFMIPLHQHHTA